ERERKGGQGRLARATVELDGPQQSRSIVQLDEIVSRLEALRVQASLPTRGRDLLVQAYELRARAYFNIGLQEKASESFRQLVQVKPDHTVTKDRVSPKIVDLFNTVKKALVGYVAVSSQPAGARVMRGAGDNDRPALGRAADCPRALLARGHARRREGGLPAGVTAHAPRAEGGGAARDIAHPDPRERVLRHRARGCRDLGGRRAQGHDRGEHEPRDVRRDPDEGPRPRARLRAHGDREPLAGRAPPRAAQEVLRDR